MFTCMAIFRVACDDRYLASWKLFGSIVGEKHTSMTLCYLDAVDEIINKAGHSSFCL